jgi:hypothetical protein
MNHLKRILITAFSLVVLLGLSSVQHAQASETGTNPRRDVASSLWTFTDNMETSQSLWHCENYDGSPSDGCNNPSTVSAAHSGTGSWDLNLSVVGAWTGLGRTVQIPQLAALHSCSAAIYLRSHSSSNTTLGGWTTSEGQLEVIDPATWTYLKVTRYTIGSNPVTWYWITGASWSAYAGQQVYVRLVTDSVSVNEHQIVVADDLTVQCSYN